MNMKGANGKILAELTLIFGVAAGVVLLSSACFGTLLKWKSGEQRKLAAEEEEDKAYSVELATPNACDEHDHEVAIAVPLPSGWVELVTDEGETYYYNEASEVSLSYYCNSCQPCLCVFENRI